MLDVPGWFWEAVDLGAVIESGAVSPADLTGRAWQLGIVALAELGQARRVAEWKAEQRRAAVERNGVRRKKFGERAKNRGRRGQRVVSPLGSDYY